MALTFLSTQNYFSFCERFIVNYHHIFVRPCMFTSFQDLWWHDQFSNCFVAVTVLLNRFFHLVEKLFSAEYIVSKKKKNSNWECFSHCVASQGMSIACMCLGTIPSVFCCSQLTNFIFIRDFWTVKDPTYPPPQKNMFFLVFLTCLRLFCLK